MIENQIVLGGNMKDWIGNKASTYKQLGARNNALTDRETNDFYATDPKALELFLEQLEKDNLKLHKTIWECACGEGHLSKLLESKGYNVLSSDLINRGYGEYGIDFLKVKSNELYKEVDILTNPPYKYAQDFVNKALELLSPEHYCIMILKIQFLEGQTRKKLFEKYPPQYVYVHSTRQLCAINGEFDKYKSKSPALCYAWFIWKKGYSGETIVRWI